MPQPHWAIGLYENKMCVGAVLLTRDGRRSGNAVAIDVDLDIQVATVVTDFGNTMLLGWTELEEMFYRPNWIMDINTHTGYNKWKANNEPT